MHINYNDPILWLAYRYSCDAQARNPEIEHKFLEFFDHHAHQLHITDVGAGTGANFRYYFNKIKQDQDWTLIEQDPHIIRACHICLEKFAHEHQYNLQQEGEDFLITSAGKTARIRTIQGSLDHIEQLTDLQKADVVTANAVFDLISYDQFDRLAGKLSENKVCLLATMNYYETSFLPFSEKDHWFMQLYHTHMTRPQSFGIAMGPNCVEEMLDLLAQHHMLIEQEGSQWHISRRHTTMQHFLLQFIENAIKDLSLADGEQKDFNEWIAERKAQSHDRALEIYVDHCDIFAYPD